jgi:hypothetical protein
MPFDGVNAFEPTPAGRRSGSGDVQLVQIGAQRDGWRVVRSPLRAAGPTTGSPRRRLGAYPRERRARQISACPTHDVRG